MKKLCQVLGATGAQCEILGALLGALAPFEEQMRANKPSLPSLLIY